MISGSEYLTCLTTQHKTEWTLNEWQRPLHRLLFYFYAFCFFFLHQAYIFILIKILCLLEWLPISSLCSVRQADPAHMFNALSHFHVSVPVSLFSPFLDYFWPGSFYSFNSWYCSLTVIGGGTSAASARVFLWLTFTGSGYLDGRRENIRAQMKSAPPPDPLCTYRCHQSFLFGSISMATKRPFAKKKKNMQQIYWMQPWLPMGWRGEKWLCGPWIDFHFFFFL